MGRPWPPKPSVIVMAHCCRFQALIGFRVLGFAETPDLRSLGFRLIQVSGFRAVGGATLHLTGRDLSPW